MPTKSALSGARRADVTGLGAREPRVECLALPKSVEWGKFNDAETAVVQEAGASATIYRLTTGPDPEAVATRAALGNYLRLAIDRDWPLMATGKESREVTQALNALYAVALRLPIALA